MSQTMRFEQLLERDGVLSYTNEGVSMLPLLRQGRDLMIIQKKGAAPLRKLDAVLYRRPQALGRGEYVLHRILRVNGDGSYWIIGDNCVTGETVAEEQILGVLSAVVRDGKRIPVTALCYRLYVNTWCRWYRLRIRIQRSWALARRCLRKLVRTRKN